MTSAVGSLSPVVLALRWESGDVPKCRSDGEHSSLLAGYFPAPSHSDEDRRPLTVEGSGWEIPRATTVQDSRVSRGRRRRPVDERAI